MNEEVENVLKGISHTGYTTELEKAEARILIEKLYEENQQLKEQLKTSEKARKEAIELIKELYDNTDDPTCYDIDKDEKERLLQILDIDKGEMKDE